MAQHPNCRACNGSGSHYSKSGKSFVCKACGGRGINLNLWETHCRNCYKAIIFKDGQSEPTFCRDCRNREVTKRCEQWGCMNTIRYKMGWTSIPSYCGSCRRHRERGDTAKSCASCSKLIWVPAGKNFTMCRECNERERAKKAAQWRTKSCKICGGEIKYHVDWNHVPDLCKSCKEKEKAKWKEKPCAGCGAPIKYHVDWDHPPNFCKSCKEKGTRRRHESNQSENPRYRAAVGKRGADLTVEEEHRFREYYHKQPDRERMPFDKIVEMATEWRVTNGGGFRRSDRRR